MSGKDRPRSKRPRRSKSALWREHDGRAVLFHEDTGRAFVLNEAGAGIWKALDGERTIEDLLASVAEPQRDRALESVRDFCAAVEEAGLIEYGEGIGSSDPGAAPFIPPAAWEDPEAEEIMFGACDCVPGVGNTRNLQCQQLGIPQQSSSTI